MIVKKFHPELQSTSFTSKLLERFFPAPLAAKIVLRRSSVAQVEGEALA